MEHEPDAQHPEIIVEATPEPQVDPVITEPIQPPHELIQTAQRMLEAGPSSNVSQYNPYDNGVEVYTPQTGPPVASLSAFEKFPDVTAQLRDETGDGIDLFRVRKLNLAATVETLERSVTAHEAFPSADAGISVAKLAEQVNILTRELEKSQNPFLLFDRIMDEAMQPLTASLVKSLAEESRWLIAQFEHHLPESKKPAFRETVKQMAMRIGPPLKDALDVSKTRLLVALNLQDKIRK